MTVDRLGRTRRCVGHEPSDDRAAMGQLMGFARVGRQASDILSDLRWMLHAVDAHGRYAGFGFASPDLRSVEDQSRGHPARPIEG